MNEQRQKQDRIQDIAVQVARINEENQRLFRQVVEGERRFRGLARAVWQVQEDERRRLARELHDSIGQTLVGLIHQLERLDKRVGGGGDLLADAQSLAHTALDETRELSRLLRPPVLDDLGIEAALKWLVRTMSERTGVNAALNCKLETDRFEAELETLMFRVVQEALNNVVKHAPGALVSISLRQDAATIELEIADEGPGFDAAGALARGGVQAGSGLRGMQDRVELFGGRFTIRSEPGRGTRVYVTLPREVA